jgi:SAM-dependent methyltransferase
MEHPPSQHVAESLGFGISTRSLAELLDYFHSHQHQHALAGGVPRFLEGFCYVCQCRQKFSILQQGSEINWRETLRCPDCDLINRWRSSVHVFEALCSPAKNNRLYITEAVTPLFKLFKQRYENTVGSEYVAGKKSGEWIETRGASVLVQDVTELSFGNQEFHALLSFDVLEHVPDYQTAINEFFRVLKPGGWLIFSAPFSFVEKTEVRASIQPDGSIEHHLPPDYHGDPLSNEGVLCFQSFGMDLLDLLDITGFADARILGFTDRMFGYEGENILFLAQKPVSGRSRWRNMLNWPGGDA